MSAVIQLSEHKVKQLTTENQRCLKNINKEWRVIADNLYEIFETYEAKNTDGEKGWVDIGYNSFKDYIESNYEPNELSHAKAGQLVNASINVHDIETYSKNSSTLKALKSQSFSVLAKTISTSFSPEVKAKIYERALKREQTSKGTPTHDAILDEVERHYESEQRKSMARSAKRSQDLGPTKDQYSAMAAIAEGCESINSCKLTPKQLNKLIEKYPSHADRLLNNVDSALDFLIKLDEVIER